MVLLGINRKKHVLPMRALATFGSYGNRNSSIDIPSVLHPDLRTLAEPDLVDCMVARPGWLFYNTQIPVCLWFLAKNGAVGIKNNARLFVGETKLSLVA